MSEEINKVDQLFEDIPDSEMPNQQEDVYSINEEKVIVPKENDMFSEKEEDNRIPS